MVDNETPEVAAQIHTKARPRFSKWPPLILLAIFLCVFGWNGLMVRHWDSLPVRAFTAVIPIPAVGVNGDVISYHDVLKRKDILVWLNTDEMKEETLLVAAVDALVNQKVTEQIAKELDVEVTKEDLEKELEVLKAGRSDDDFWKEVKTVLNMREKAFTSTVLEPFALAKKLDGAVVTSAKVQEVPKREIEEIQRQLNEGASFSTLAQQFSDDPSAVDGGDIGYVTAATVPEGWEALLNLPEGGTTSIIETPREFVIARVAWLVGGEDEVQIRTQAIVVKKKTFSELFEETLAKSIINKTIRLSE
ncbi:MAG: peptidylprolyl isomerase [Patescibacteria group bacterium]